MCNILTEGLVFEWGMVVSDFFPDSLCLNVVGFATVGLVDLISPIGVGYHKIDYMVNNLNLSKFTCSFLLGLINEG